MTEVSPAELKKAEESQHGGVAISCNLCRFTNGTAASPFGTAQWRSST